MPDPRMNLNSGAMPCVTTVEPRPADRRPRHRPVIAR